MDAERLCIPRPQYHTEVRAVNEATASGKSVVLRRASGHGKHPAVLGQPLLEGENVTALGATTSQNAATALRTAANEEAVSAGTLGLGGLIGTLGSHDVVSFVSREKLVETELSLFSG